MEKKQGEIKKKVACIVVTFNRKNLLIKCLDSIQQQSYRPHTVFIVDNASTDGTRQLVCERNYLDTTINGVTYVYIQLPENIGGSGGFYTGMKTAFESDENFDAFWLMDDDGITDKDQLSSMLPYIDRYGYVSPNVRSIEDASVGAFFKPSPNQETDENGNYLGVANPFNGVLYSREVVGKVGYPVKNMFIWGDEVNYDSRCIKAGYSPIIVVKAIHFHPKNRQIKVPSWLGREIAVPEQNWKLYCYARNRVFNSRTINGLGRSLGRTCIDFLDFFFALIKLKQLRRLYVVVVAQLDGLKGVLPVSRKFV